MKEQMGNMVETDDINIDIDDLVTGNLNSNEVEGDVFNYSVSEEEVGSRIDIFLTQKHSELTRTHIQKLITEEMVKINGQITKANYKLKISDQVEIVIPVPKELNIDAENIPIEIIYEDKDVVVVNKPQGMVVHPANGIYSGTLVNALMYHCKDLSGINGIMRPGIVHRIDKDTSGILVVAKNDQAHLSLAKQIKDKTVTRLYKALVHGNIPEPAGIIDAPIGRDPKDRQRMAVVVTNSKDAVTRYKVIERYIDYTLIEAKLETGRTHQIRVHMSYLNHPVVGDPKYGPRKPHFGLKGQALHAEVLGFEHPATGEYMEFKAPVPEYFEKIIRNLEDKIRE